jgi:hypothetical protein
MEKKKEKKKKQSLRGYLRACYRAPLKIACQKHKNTFKKYLKK